MQDAVGVKKVLNGEIYVAGQVTGIRPQSGMLRQSTKSNFSPAKR